MGSILVCQIAAQEQVAAQEPVATLTRVQGEVVVVSRESGREVAARQVGPRVRNGSVQGGDRVRTGSGASAQMTFEDGSEVELGEGTEIEVRSVDLSQLAAEGRRAKPIARRFSVHSGEITSRVVDNPDVDTELSSEAGVVSLGVGVVTLSVDGGADTRVRCQQGEARFRSPSTGLTLDLSAGLGFELKRSGPDLWQVEMAESNAGSVSMTLANGRRLGAVPGTRMTARLDGYSVELKVDRGRAVADAGE